MNIKRWTISAWTSLTTTPTNPPPPFHYPNMTDTAPSHPENAKSHPVGHGWDPHIEIPPPLPPPTTLTLTSSLDMIRLPLSTLQLVPIPVPSPLPHAHSPPPMPKDQPIHIQFFQIAPPHPPSLWLHRQTNRKTQKSRTFRHHQNPRNCIVNLNFDFPRGGLHRPPPKNLLELTFFMFLKTSLKRPLSYLKKKEKNSIPFPKQFPSE